MGDILNKEMTDIVKQMQSDRILVNMPELTEAIEAVQDDLANDLVKTIIDTVERNVSVEYDENEDGKFTYVELGPNLADQLKDDIAEYILEKR